MEEGSLQGSVIQVAWELQECGWPRSLPGRSAKEQVHTARDIPNQNRCLLKWISPQSKLNVRHLHYPILMDFRVGYNQLVHS